MYNIVVLCSGILYTLSKVNNSSFNLIARNAVQVMIILYSQFYNPSCNFIRNKNKYLYCFFIDFKKFVKLLILTNFLRLWKAVQVLQSSLKIQIDKLKNLVCVNRILDLKQKQSLKISIIIATKKLCLTFLDKEQSLFHQLAFLLKNIKTICSRNLFKSFVIFITAEGGIFFKKYNCGGGLMLVRKLTYKNILGEAE